MVGLYGYDTAVTRATKQVGFSFGENIPEVTGLPDSNSLERHGCLFTLSLVGIPRVGSQIILTWGCAFSILSKSAVRWGNEVKTLQVWMDPQTLQVWIPRTVGLGAALTVAKASTRVFQVRAVLAGVAVLPP